MDFSKAPKASQLIEALQKLISEHGDLPVCAKDPDTSLRMAIGIVYRPENIIEQYPSRFEIRTSYDGDPKGKL